MASLKTRQILKAIVKTLVFASVTASPSVFSQPEFDLAETDAQRQIVERIREMELEGGLNSANLIEPLSGLALLYEESGDHVLSSTVIRRALEIVRIHHGLYSLEQAPLIRRLVESEEIIGNVEEAWNQEQELLALAERHPNDIRTVPVFRETADRRMALLERFAAGEFPPQIVLGCYYQPIRRGVCDSGSRSSAISAILSDAQRSYAEAISVLLRNELYSSDELRELEMEIVRSDYSYGRRHWAGQSLGRVLSYEQRVSAPTLTQANALVLIADHQLWLSQGTSAYESALELYETAYRQLREGGIEQRTIDEIFTPELPVVLPAPLSNPLASSNTSGSAGYMDVVFGITKYGRPENIEILDTARGVTGAAERDLVQLITRRRFRPRVSDEHFPDVTRVTVRYYLAE